MSDYTKRFDGKGKAYAASRPGYPAELFEQLVQENILTADTAIADVGAGTGLFSCAAAPYVKTVYAIDPSEDMLEQGRKAMEKSGVKILPGTAEKIPLPDASVDLISAAHCFHWFDKTAFLKECQRVLKPDGKVLILWNQHGIESPATQDNMQANTRFCKNWHQDKPVSGMSSSDQFDGFFQGDIQCWKIENPVIYDREGFLNRNFSSSYALKPEDPDYADWVQALDTIFDRYEDENHRLSYSYQTVVYLGSVN